MAIAYPTKTLITFFSVGTIFFAQLALSAPAAKPPTPAAKPTVPMAPVAAATTPAAKETATKEKTEEPKAVEFTAKDLWDKQLFERDDNKVLVIQDRKYNKAKRLELGFDLGVTSASAFYNSYTFGARTAYYFNEYWGIQAFGNFSMNTDTREKEQLQEYLELYGFPSTKETRQPKLFTGLGVVWSPIYGKFAFFRRNIIHYDIYAGAGVSYLTTEQVFLPFDIKGKSEGHIGTLLNLGVRIFLNKNFTWTTEVRNNIYSANYSSTTSTGGITVPGKKVLSNNWQFTTGLSYMFNLGGF